MAGKLGNSKHAKFTAFFVYALAIFSNFALVHTQNSRTPITFSRSETLIYQEILVSPATSEGNGLGRLRFNLW